MLLLLNSSGFGQAVLVLEHLGGRFVYLQGIYLMLHPSLNRK
jgi:hypothetical protein